MSYVIAEPAVLGAAASDLACIASAISAANTAASAPTTEVTAAAADEVSTQIAEWFARHARGYQAIAAQAAGVHDRFVWALTASARSYAGAEAVNAPPLQAGERHALNAINAPTGAFVNPFTTWLDVATLAVANLSSLTQFIFAAPAPVLRQIIINLIDYASALVTAVSGLVGATVHELSLLPAVVHTALGDFVSGDVVGGIGALWAYTFGFPAQVAAAAHDSLLPALSIPSDIVNHLGNLVSVSTLEELAFDLAKAVQYPVNATVAACVVTAQDIVTAAQQGDVVTILRDLVNFPATGTGAVLNGFSDPAWLALTGTDPVGALLTNPATGPGFGSVYNLLQARETIAAALGADPAGTNTIGAL